jgi:hypothetical protein
MTSHQRIPQNNIPERSVRQQSACVAREPAGAAAHSPAELLPIDFQFPTLLLTHVSAHCPPVALSGDRYEGDWLNNQAQGRGKYIYVNGNRYEGLWKSNQMDGHGKLWFASGDHCQSRGDIWAMVVSVLFSLLPADPSFAFSRRADVGDFKANKLEGHGKVSVDVTRNGAKEACSSPVTHLPSI